MFGFKTSAHCLGCGRELPVPGGGSATRVLANVDDEAEVYLDMTEWRCPQCGGAKVRIRMEFTMAVDVGAGD